MCILYIQKHTALCPIVWAMCFHLCAVLSPYVWYRGQLGCRSWMFQLVWNWLDETFLVPLLVEVTSQVGRVLAVVLCFNSLWQRFPVEPPKQNVEKHQVHQFHRCFRLRFHCFQHMFIGFGGFSCFLVVFRFVFTPMCVGRQLCSGGGLEGLWKCHCHAAHAGSGTRQNPLWRAMKIPWFL